MDLMILIDGSGSMNQKEFAKTLRFIQNVTSGLDMSRHKIGVMQYSHYFYNRFAKFASTKVLVIKHNSITHIVYCSVVTLTCLESVSVSTCSILVG